MWRTRIAPIIAPAVIVPAALLLAACSSASKPSASPASAATPAAAAASPAAASPAAAAKKPGRLSGTWQGQYSGTFSGTFTLHWQQSGSKLTGTINLPEAGGKTPINGTVDGSSIKFGTVGSTAITYSGSVSGRSMSGSYKIKTQSGSAGGSWSASRS